MTVGFFGAALLLPGLFNLTALPFRLVAVTAGFAVVSAPILQLLSYGMQLFGRNRKKDRRKRRGDRYYA
jgi:hypothetical protein